MIIAGEGKNPAFEHIRLVGEEFQIREKDVIEITEKVMEALENWKEFAREAGIRFRSYSGLVHFGKKTSKGPSLTKYAAQVPWFLHVVSVVDDLKWILNSWLMSEYKVRYKSDKQCGLFLQIPYGMVSEIPEGCSCVRCG